MSTEEILRDEIAVTKIYIAILIKENKELKAENKALLDSLNSQDTAEEMTIEEMLNREG